MGFFTEHIKQETRFKCKYFTFMNPTDEQEAYIRDIMQNSMKTTDETEDIDIEGTFDYDLIKWIIKELSNVGEGVDDLSAEDFNTLIDKGDIVVEELMYQVELLLSEIGTKITREQSRMIDTVEKYIELLDVGNKVDNVKSKVVEVFQKKGINLSSEECLALLSDPQKLTEALEEADRNNKNKKPSPTRTRKKKK